LNVEMKAQSIAATTGMGAVELAVTDAHCAMRFYREYVGLTPTPGDGPEIHVGVARRELVMFRVAGSS
jgi:catechol-2,3-dioxygenase